jgi:hypothetical protein
MRLAHGSILLALSFGASAWGCSSSERDLRLLPKDDAAVSAERARLQRMQMIRVVDATDPDNPKEEHWEPWQISDWLDTYQCLAEVGSKDFAFGYMERKLCVAQQLLAMASDRAAPVRLFDSFRPNLVLVVPAQSAATNAALAQEAMQVHAIQALRHGLCEARVAVGLPALSNEVGTPSCGDNPVLTQAQWDQLLAGRINSDGTYDPSPTVNLPGSISVGAHLADRILEAYHVFREAAERTAALNVAVADAQRANPSVSLQVSRGLAGFALSRSAAAHILVGGTPGLLGSTNDEPRPGLCSVAELSPQATKALAILRDAGVSPSAVLANDVTLDELLNGGTSANVPGGSVVQRFAERWGFDFDDPPASIDVQDSIADYFNLRADDFEAARRYLAQEIAAFGRSLTEQQELPPVEGGTYKRFVGTATPPQELPPEYYGAIAGYHVWTNIAPPSWFLPRITLPGDSTPTSIVNLSQGIDAALTHAAQI